eukprot:6549137-Lingulodinium_polyedra.AAC.1
MRPPRGSCRAPAGFLRVVRLGENKEEFCVRPKMHLCQEVFEMSPGSSPVKNWICRGEDLF